MASKIPPPEVIRVSSIQVACDGSGEISPELGHPRVFLRIDEEVGFDELRSILDKLTLLSKALTSVAPQGLTVSI